MTATSGRTPGTRTASPRYSSPFGEELTKQCGSIILGSPATGSRQSATFATVAPLSAHPVKLIAPACLVDPFTGVSMSPNGGAGEMLVWSLALAETAPPPETVTVLVACNGANAATLTVAVIAG